METTGIAGEETFLALGVLVETGDQTRVGEGAEIEKDPLEGILGLAVLGERQQPLEDPVLDARLPPRQQRAMVRHVALEHRLLHPPSQERLALQAVEQVEAQYHKLVRAVLQVVAACLLQERPHVVQPAPLPPTPAT